MIKINLLEKQDLIKIVEWNANKTSNYLLQWAGPSYKFPLTLSQVQDYFNDSKNNKLNIFIYKILLTETDEMIGTIEICEMDEENIVGKVGKFLIGEELLRGKGIGTVVLKEILRIGFEDLKFQKIIIRVFDFNLNAIKCYEKVGFIKEKVIENERKATDGYWNLYEMAISRAEWELEN